MLRIFWYIKFCYQVGTAIRALRAMGVIKLLLPNRNCNVLRTSWYIKFCYQVVSAVTYINRQPYVEDD